MGDFAILFLTEIFMTTLSTQTYAEQLFTSYESYRVDSFRQVIDDSAKTSSGLLSSRKAGDSFEGRPIRLISAGTGQIVVLLWSQMHGDEPTATMAIADMLQYLMKAKNDTATQLILSSLSFNFLPLLNPDGAARFQRRTAQGIDMNRDALALCTPEARILKQLQHELNPHFGFNLHDQELSTVGTSNKLTAIALLAPAFDHEKSDNDVRTRAKQVAATFASIMNLRAANNIARYDDSFEPRAFGDNMQKWGTSTVLVESGHALNDPEKKIYPQTELYRFACLSLCNCH